MVVDELPEPLLRLVEIPPHINIKSIRFHKTGGFGAPSYVTQHVE